MSVPTPMRLKINEKSASTVVGPAILETRVKALAILQKDFEIRMF